MGSSPSSDTYPVRDFNKWVYKGLQGFYIYHHVIMCITHIRDIRGRMEGRIEGGTRGRGERKHMCDRIRNTHVW